MKTKVWHNTNSDGDKLTLEFVSEGLDVSYRGEDSAGAIVIPMRPCERCPRRGLKAVKKNNILTYLLLS